MSKHQNNKQEQAPPAAKNEAPKSEPAKIGMTETLERAIVAEAIAITKGKHHIQDLMILCKQHPAMADKK